MQPARGKTRGGGRRSVGHPVDPSSGTLYQEFEDHVLEGRVPVVFGRRYSTGLEGKGRMFGPGWCSPFEAYLYRSVDGYTMIAEDGELEVNFTDWYGAIERGEPKRDLGNCCELRREGAERFVVRRWSPEDPDEVTELVFREGVDNDDWPLVAKQDLEGQGFDIERDEAGRVVEVRQRREGRSYRLVNDRSSGRVVEVYVRSPARAGEEAQERQVLSYSYDGRGRLCEAVDALGQVSRYSYGADGRLERERNVAGMEWSFRYDEAGRCVETSGENDFARVELEYDDLGVRTRVTDALGQVTTYDWNEFGQATCEGTPLGHAKLTDFDVEGRVVAEKTAEGRETRYAFDERGDRVEVVAPGGAVTRFAYNDFHQLLAVTDPAGQVWRRRYDGWGRLEEVLNPQGARLRYRYDQRGDLVAVEDPLGARRELGWDARGDLAWATDWEGNRTSYEHDREGRLVAAVDPLGRRTEATLDALGRVEEVRLPDGAVRRFRWDAYDQPLEYVDELEAVTRWRYEACGLPKEVVRPDGGKLRFDWSPIPGQLLGVVNERGERHQLKYDADGHLVEEQDFGGRLTRYENDFDGLPLEVESGGKKTSIKRDDDGAVVEVQHGDGTRQRYAFDPRGLVVKAVSGEVTVERSYDEVGRLLSEKQGEHSVESVYDAAGNRVLRRSSLGQETAFGWNANGQLASLGWPTSTTARPLRFAYDARQDELARSVPGGVSIEQGLDARGRRSEQRVLPGSGLPPLFERRYGYDAASNLTSIADTQWGTSRFAYDAVGRMLGAELGERLSERLRYDLCDNVVGIARRSPDDEGGEREEVCGYGPGNLLERRGEVVHRYDEAGQVVERVDGDGRRTRYLWDGAGRLVQAILPDRSEWRYSYDAFGRRVSKDGPTEVVEFVWDGDVVLHEIHRPRAQTKPGRRQWPPPMPEPPRVIDWEYEPESFAPIGKRDGDSSYLCVNDPAGNPRELVSDEGEVVWRALYSAFGELVAEERGNGVGCPVRLQGQWHDEETGLSYNRFRYYDPAFGRFISPDPLRVFGGVNLYSYGANTTGWTDPFGLTVTAGEAGAFGALDRRAVSHDKLTPHHMPQDALGFLPRSEGGAIVLPHAEHVLTRTYGGKGGATKKADAGLSFRDVLAKDLRDLRRIAGGKYDQGIRDLLRYYRKNHPQMMKRKQGKCPRT